MAGRATGTGLGLSMWVPDAEDSEDDLLPLEDPFGKQGADLLANIQQLLRRMRSQRLFTDAFDDAGGWDVTKQKLRIVGESMAYFEVDLTRTGGTIHVPDDGNIPPVLVGTISLAAGRPQSLAGLRGVNTGPLITGHALANGEVYIDAVSTWRDILDGDQITLAGPWPLDSWFDSEA